MKKPILLLQTLLLSFTLPAQNLVVNGDAENPTRGYGWTVISSGALTCLLVPTNNMVNWTMKPNGTANYPFDHTTGANGGTVFFSGCDTYFTGPFETQQTIELSADAAAIDAGSQLYDFSGYMQTPVEPQTDVGRYIVEFKNASNAVLGSSYTTDWQSNFNESGIGWVHYSNSRIAPVGTRKVTIRLQTYMYVNQPAINVYFDDISFSKATVVPVNIISFTGFATGSGVQLNWKPGGDLTPKIFEVQRSTDGVHFIPVGTVAAAGSVNYHFTDNRLTSANKYFYRLRAEDFDGKITYSTIISINTKNNISFSLSPNPASNHFIVNNAPLQGKIVVINSNGAIIKSGIIKSNNQQFDITGLAAGLYIVRIESDKGNGYRKLLIMQ